MKAILSCVILMTLPLLSQGQVNNEVSLTELIREIQQWNKRDNKMSLSWWIPNEYWRIALAENKQIPKETVKQFENVFENYVMIWACDVTINPDATMNYTSAQELERTIKIIDENGKIHSPLMKNQINGEALATAENMKPFFAQALGQMGKGLHFFFFKIIDDSNKSLINATSPGEFKVSHSNSDFSWKLPLTTLLSPKFCPVDKEKMKGNWLYCPIHGVSLDN